MAAQGSDLLVLEGRRRRLFGQPLEPYLRDLPTRPNFRIQDPANSQGYIATWEIQPDNTLWLTALQTCPQYEAPEPGIRLVFPDASGPVFARWVSQQLRSPDGDQVRYEPLGYGMRHARETSLQILRGKLVLTEEIDGRTSKRTSSEFTSHLEEVFGSEEGAFLRASHSTPEDSAPRLVYADWLDERDDPRGTLIRIAERLRDATPEVEFRELTSIRELPRQTRLNRAWKLWMDIMGYDELWKYATLG
jgi:uncharacterized protein (TIGR02996 family)